MFSLGVLRSNDTNSIYYKNGYLAKMEYPMNEEGQTLFDLLIAHEIEEDNSGDALKDFMNEKNIKAFLDSIK